MKCHNCKNNLYLENGMYVCKNCGYTTPVHNKQLTDVFICCTQISPQGSPTIDSMMARELYFKLKEKNIDAFYAQESLLEYPEAERKAAFDCAIESARIIIITGSSKTNFENMINSYGTRLTNKAVIPVYTSMYEADIPRTSDMFPAINYDSRGSVDNVCKDISNMLNLLESKEHTPTAAVKKRKKIKITAVVISIFVIIGIIGFVAYKFFVAPKLADAKNYETAQSLSEDKKYIEAIDMYYTLGNYKDSVDLLGKLYTRYNGLYQDDQRMVDLDLAIVNKIAKIKISEHYGNKVITAKTSADVKNNIIEFEYEDSSAIKGSGTIELFDDYITLSIKSEASNKYCISTGTVDFYLDKTKPAEKPEQAPEITIKHFMNWLDSGITKSELENMGYTFEKVYTKYPSDDVTSLVYKINETDMLTEFLINPGSTVDKATLFSVVADANFIIPDSINSPCLPFEQNDTVYWPGEGVYWGEESHWDAAVVPTESKIRKSTLITLVTKASYERIDSWDNLLNSVKQRNIGASIGKENFVIETENDESYLVSFEDGSSIKFYSVNKNTYKSEYITKFTPDQGEESADFWKDNPELFPDFSNKIASSSSDDSDDIFYRVRKSPNDNVSQQGAFEDLDRAKAVADELKDEGYKVYDNNGNLIYTP